MQSSKGDSYYIWIGEKLKIIGHIVHFIALSYRTVNTVLVTAQFVLLRSSVQRMFFILFVYRQGQSALC